MGREIYDIINDMAEVLNASQMQKLQEVLIMEGRNGSKFLQVMIYRQNHVLRLKMVKNTLAWAVFFGLQILIIQNGMKN